MKDVQDEIEMANTDVEDFLDVDYGTVDSVIQAQRVVALENQRLDAAIEVLLNLENEMRSAADVARTRRVVVAIIELCYEARAWKTLNDQILLLSQRRAQLNQAIVAMVQRAVSYLDDTPDLDTRNKLIETLNNVSIGKGSRNVCWYVVLTPHDSLQSGPTKPSLEDSNLSELDLSCESSLEQAQGFQEQFQELTGEQFLTPTCESRPNTPPPQQENKPRDMPPSIGRLPVKKRGNLIRKTLRPVRRRLFDPPSPADVEDFLSGLEHRDEQRFIKRYNFDPVKDEPLPGRFEWVPLRPERPQLTRTTSIDSSTEVRRPELASTMSA